MEVAMSKGVANFERKREIAHKIHLIQELEYDGYKAAIRYKTEEDINYIKSILGKNLDVVATKLKKELYSL